MSRILTAATVAALTFTGTSALAQSNTDEEIIVTAQRREQSVQDVSVAVSVVSGAELIEQGVTTVNGLENLAPSLEVESQFGGGQPSFSLRGVGFKDYGSNNSPTVGVYVDEVAYTVPIMTQGVMYDVERVEVLRGPQGTLYGRNTTGGAINVISARPRDEFAAGVTAELGNYDAFRAEGYINWALGGGAAARISATTAHGGAWQENRETGEMLGDADRFAIRGQLAWPITENFDVLLNLHGFQDQSDGLGLQLFKTTPSGVAHGYRQTSWGFSPAFAAEHGFAPTSGPFRDNEGYGGSINANWDLGGASLRYILSNENLDRRELNDWDALPSAVAGVYFETDASVTQHELRLTSEGDNVFDWIVGLYFGNEDLTDVYASDFGSIFGVQLAVPYGQEVETQAVFAQAEYQISPSVNLIAGIRYEDEERRLKDFTTTIGGIGPVIPRTNNSTEMQETSGRLAIEWTPSDDVLYYASISRGVKSGGFTAYNSFSTDAVGAFRPEILLAYEVGFKSDLFDRRLRLNGAAYFYDYTDQQVQNAIFLVPQNTAIGRISNAQSEVYGVELEAVWRPIDPLTISQTIGYVHGEFTEFIILDIAASNTAGMPVGRDAAGERLNGPQLTYNGSISYDGSLGANWGWRGSLDYSYRGDTDPPLLKPLSGEGYGVPEYWLVNANLALHPNDGNWEVALWGRNLFDEDYDETRNFFAGVDLTPISAPGLPRTYGVRVSLHY